MATYSEHEQRMLDQESGAELDRIADRKNDHLKFDNLGLKLAMMASLPPSLVRLRLTWRSDVAPRAAVNNETLTIQMTEREAKRRARTYGDLGYIVAIAIERAP